MAEISINQIANEITKAIKEYSYEVLEEIQISKKELSKEAVKKLKSRSPKKTGKYAKGWTQTVSGNDIVIYNKTKGQITHLLEHGYVKADGGRTAGKPHIRPVEEEIVEEFEKRVEKAIKG